MKKQPITNINNAIVISNPAYIPAFITSNNKSIPQRCYFIVMIKDDKQKYHVNAFGKRADFCSKTCCLGAIVSMKVTPKNRKGKEVYIIDKIVIDGIHDRIVKAEIAEGKRPANWDNPFHPDYNVWQACIKMRNGIVYDGKSETFGFAHVCKPGESISMCVLDAYRLNIRSAHTRTYKHPRYVNVKDKQVFVKETVVGPRL